MLRINAAIVNTLMAIMAKRHQLHVFDTFRCVCPTVGKLRIFLKVPHMMHQCRRSESLGVFAHNTFAVMLSDHSL